MSISDIVDTVSEPVNKLLVPLASSVGSTMQDMWELVFGGFGTFVEKKRLSRLKNLEDFKKSLEDKVANIPENHLCEPSLSIVGPALEASKYYFEEPEIREMFANLLASSVDDRTASKVHPSFCEIIKQLSPIDAQNLACFSPFDQALPLAEFQVKAQNNWHGFSDYSSMTNLPYALIMENVFLSNPNVNNLQMQSVSIASLLRQGLIAKSHTRSLQDNKYEIFKQTLEYQELLDICAEEHEKTPFILKGIVFLTPLGENFCSICLPVADS